MLLRRMQEMKKTKVSVYSQHRCNCRGP